MAITAKTFEYAVEVDEAGRMTIPGGGQFVPPEGWSADHLLLAALVRCSVDGFAYDARPAVPPPRPPGGPRRDGVVRLRAGNDHEGLVRRPLPLRRDRPPDRRRASA